MLQYYYGAVALQHYSEGLDQFFNLSGVPLQNKNWTPIRAKSWLLALWEAYNRDYLTSGPNWVNNLSGHFDGGVEIYIKGASRFSCYFEGMGSHREIFVDSVLSQFEISREEVEKWLPPKSSPRAYNSALIGGC